MTVYYSPSQAPFLLYKSVLPWPCRDLHGAAMIADLRLQFSADPEKVCLCWRNIWQSIYFRSTDGRKYGRKEKAKGAKENTVRPGNRQLSTSQLVVLLILHSNSTSGLITKVTFV